MHTTSAAIGSANQTALYVASATLFSPSEAWWATITFSAIK